MAFITPVDQALYDLLSTPATVVRVNSTNYNVRVSIEPPEEQAKKAVYPLPSISIQFFGMSDAPEREVERIYQYSDLTSTTMKKRAAPIKVNLRYQITTHAYYAEHDRTLVKLIMKLLPPKGSTLLVTEEGFTAPAIVVAPAVQTYQKYRLGVHQDESMRNLDSMGEYREFKKAFSYTVLGWLDEATAEVKKLNYAGVELDIARIEETGYHS